MNCSRVDKTLVLNFNGPHLRWRNTNARGRVRSDSLLITGQLHYPFMLPWQITRRH
nr:MAG TPA: hypothetical protein [Caudoviricetes sp.]